MGNKINDGNKDGILIQVRRSDLPIANQLLQNEILNFGEILYLNRPKDSEVTLTSNGIAGKANKPIVIIGDADETNTVPNEYAIKLVNQTMVDNSIYYKENNNGKYLTDDEGNLIDKLNIKGDVHIHCDDMNDKGDKVAVEESLAPEWSSKTYPKGSLIYYNGRMYYNTESTNATPPKSPWVQTTLSDYINKFGGKIDSASIQSADMSIYNDGKKHLLNIDSTTKEITIPIPTKVSQLVNDQVFLSKAYIASNVPPTNANLLWIDTSSTTNGGLKYYKGSGTVSDTNNWITVPVRWSNS